MGASVRRKDPCDVTSEGDARMSAGVYEINLEKSAIYECGATLLALLAYPQDDEEDSHRASLYASSDVTSHGSFRLTDAPTVILGLLWLGRTLFIKRSVFMVENPQRANKTASLSTEMIRLGRGDGFD